jgi:hypothetical protein
MVVVGGGSVVVGGGSVVVGGGSVVVGGIVVVGAVVTVGGIVVGGAVVGPGPWVVGGGSGGGSSGGGSPPMVGAGVKRARVVVGWSVGSGGAAVVVDATVVGAPSSENGGSVDVDVSDERSTRGAVTGDWLAACVRTADSSSALAAIEMVVTMPTPKSVLAAPAMRRSRRAG